MNEVGPAEIEDDTESSDTRITLAECIELVIAELEEQGLQSDERFVQSFVSSRISRGQGPIKIRAELRERGIDRWDPEDEPTREALARYLDEPAHPDDDLDECLRPWDRLAEFVDRQRFRSSAPDSARRARFLASRGFASETVRQVLRNQR